MNQADVGACVSGIVSVSSGASSYYHIFDKLNHYAPLIGATISLTASLFAAYFILKSYNKEKLSVSVSSKNEEAIKSMDERFVKIESGIESILDKIDKE